MGGLHSVAILWAMVALADEVGALLLLVLYSLNFGLSFSISLYFLCIDSTCLQVPLKWRR